MDLRERFEAKYIPEPNSGCWLWMGGYSAGYGQISFRGKPERAHRVAWMLYRGEIPDGKWVLHHCDNRACSNPDHLYIGTQADNMRDAAERNRIWRGRGELSGKAVLCESQVQEIKASCAPSVQLAGAYGVTPTTIWGIRSGRLWSHIEGPTAKIVRPMSERQVRVLDYVRERPGATLAEMQRHFGHRSIAGVQGAVARLMRDGHLTRVHGKLTTSSR